MDKFTTRDLLDLTEDQVSPCVTILMPTYRGEDCQQNPVRLKNLLQQAENQLSDGWMRPAGARRLLEPARDLLADSVFWEGRSRGLALFLSTEQRTHFRLPQEFEELVVVNRRFHVKPLLPLLNSNDRFLILALSQKNTRLVEATRYAIERFEVEGLPTSMEKALNYTSVDRGSQTHSATRGNQGKQGAVFHGQGGEPESHKEDLAQYFRLVDQSLRSTLNTRNLPLLLAGVEYLLPIYREVSSYPHLAEVELRGNFEHEPASNLLEKAWSVMGPSFEAKREQVAARYRQLAGTGKTSDNIENILPAAYDGRVDALFVDQATHRWGIYATASRFIEVHEEFQAGDDDLLDLAAVQTLLHNGSVYAVERDAIPENKPTVALLRY